MQPTLTFADIATARRRLARYLAPTPLAQAFYLGGKDTRYFFKLESLQHAKSFKIRGALNKMITLTAEEKARGVAAISSGNHGSSVSYAAKLLGIRQATIIVPHATPQSKIDKICYFGAKVLRMGQSYDEAHVLGMEYIRAARMTYIDAYDEDPLIYAGQGTIALELLEQNPAIDTIVVPVGGGGLITGIAVAAKAAKPGIRVFGVQTEACPAMVRSYQDGKRYAEYPSGDTLCDALVGGVGTLSYALAGSVVDAFFTVTEQSIAKAVRFLAREEKLIAEAGSATTVAAIAEHGREIGGRNVALILSGGNIDGDLLARLVCDA
jgi:threonine dehydratase